MPFVDKNSKPKEANLEPSLLTVPDAAEACSLSRAQMYRFLATGAILSIKIGRLRRIPRSAINDFIERELGSETGT